MKQLSRGEHAPHLLITMPWGIGDAVSIGLSAVDQVRRNDPENRVKVDILCNSLQAPIFEHDRRIHALIVVDKSLFPTAAAGTWKRGLSLPPQTRKLAISLRRQNYTAVLPFCFSPGFFYLLHAPILFLNIREAWDIMTMLRSYKDVSTQNIIRYIINKYFARREAHFGLGESIPLYLRPEHVQRARHYAACLRAQARVPEGRGSLLLVAPDTSSVITRPPTALLAQGLADALKRDPRLFVAILPGYTDTQASPRLWQALDPLFPGRIFQLPAEPRFPLLELAAFIDQSDIFLTGDTSTMHLAAAYKRLASPARADLFPRNTVKIIVLFGGTHPGFHGYSRRTIILGRGRKEQATFVPGIAKELYHPNGQNFFDHISPSQLTSAILGGYSFLPDEEHRECC
jgi:ADP-heptose:LPS heptosyltransferase